ncbi:MAG: fibronectin type protein, partial [Acidimicrobiales bacterium]|nr:fibronectin type protein [Acidimicrobiales bacterium]
MSSTTARTHVRRGRAAAILSLAWAVAAVAVAAVVATPVAAATTATVPNPPTNVAGVAGTGQVALKWAAPYFTNGTLTGYTVTPSVAGVARPAVTFTSTATTQTITGLTNGTTYTFTVAAINATGTSAASAASPGIIVGAPALPPFPSAVPGAGQALVRWKPPAANASAITGYVITPSLAGAAQASQTFASTATSQTISGLVDGSTYTFSVAASNASGTGATSTTAPIVVGSPVAPNQPTTAPGDAQATITWTAPSTDNGSPVTGYVVTPYLGTTAQAAQAFTSTATTQTVTGLTNASTYTFAVAATNARGTGPASTASAPLVVGAPTTPAAVQALPGAGGATVSWTAPATANGAAVTGYTVTPYVGTTAQAARTFTSTATTQTVTGLTNGTTTTFAVAAVNARGTGPQSPPSPAIVIGAAGTTPATMAAPIAVPGNGSVSVSWVAPVANGSPITSYTVAPWRNGVALASTSFAGTATGGPIPGLTNGDTLTFTISATNGVGTSTPSPLSTPIIVGTPQAASAVSATTGDAQATLVWAAPYFTNGTITGYAVTPNVNGVDQPPVTFTSPATTQTVTGLTNGATTTFRVAAVNAVGAGLASLPSAPIVVGAPAPPPFPSAVPGSGQALVRWKPASPNAGAVTGYAVTVIVGGVAGAPTAFNSTATQQTISGLVDGSSYTFSVAAINASGTGLPSPTAAIVVGSPVAPNQPTTTPGDTQAAVSWTAPSTDNASPVTGYVVTPYLAAVAQPAQTFTSTATTQAVTGLTNASTYTFAVAAINARGTGPASTASAPMTVGAPTAPTGVQAVPGSAKATVSWTAPATTNGAAVTGYTVTPYVGTTPQPAQTFTSTATTQTVTGLTNATTDTFTVAAINARGTGPGSTPSPAIVIGSVGTAPATMTAPAVLPSAGAASVSWTPPANNGSTITSYTVRPWRNGVALPATTFTGTTTGGPVPGLTNGDTLTFTITATNGVGTSAASPASTPITVGTPQAATAVSAITGDAQATLIWGAPYFTNGTITGYSVTPNLNGVDQPARTFTTNATTQTITGLTNGATTTFRVAAINATGTGLPSTPSAPIVIGAPAPPPFPSATSGDTQATLHWLAPAPNASAVTGYVITPTVNGVVQASQTFSSPATFQTISGLVDGSSYTFAVAAVNGSGTGPATMTPPVVVGSPVAPGQPTTSPGDSQVTVSWAAPSTDNGSPVTGYVVTPMVNGSALASQTFPATAASGTITGLTDATSATFTVAAVNARGTGTASAPSAPVTVGAPTPPTAVQLVPGPSQATVSWTAPASDNGSAVTGYTITPYVGTVAGLTSTFTSTATTQTVTGLSNGDTSTFVVAAINARGTGPTSAPSGAIVIGATGPAPAVMAAPSVLSSIGAASVSWVAPATTPSPITSYTVTPWRNGVALPATTFTGTTAGGPVPGLANGDTLTFTITATNGVGTSAASPASAPVVIGTPQAATAVSAIAGAGQATLVWGAPYFTNGVITGYAVTPILNGVAQPPVTFTDPSTTQIVTGLPNGVAATFTVAAVNAVGAGIASLPSAAIVVGTPAPPVFPAATSGDGRAALHWLAPAPNASAVTGYVVTPTVDGVVQASQTFSSTSTFQTVTGLPNASRVTFAVAAINASGTGPASPTPPITIGAPAAPAAPKAVPGDGTAAVTWSAPASANGSPTAGYVVTPYLGAIAQPAQTFSSTATSQTVTGLSNGSTYTFTVAAANARGTGLESAGSSPTIAGTPTAPAFVSAASGDGQAVVSWWAPAAANGSPVTGYVITPFAGTTALAAQTFSSAATSEVVTGLTNGTATAFRVTAINARGTGADSSLSAALTVGVPAPPKPPTASTAVGQATVVWAAPTANGGPISGYTVTPWRDGRRTAPITFTSTATSQTIGGLRDGASYTFTVAAVNTFGSGNASTKSATVAPGGPPAAPATPAATAGNAV